MGSLIMILKSSPQEEPPLIEDYTLADAVEDDGGDNGGAYSATWNAFYRLPRGFNAAHERTYPLLVRLHGSSVDGYLGDLSYIGMGYTSIEMTSQVNQAMGDAFRATRHCFVLVPQTEESEWDYEAVSSIVDDFCATYPVDVNRVYFHGHSMGAVGSFNTARYRALTGPVAAIVPIASRNMGDLGNTTWNATCVWTGCGLLDTADRVAYSRDIYAEGKSYFPSAPETTFTQTRNGKVENIAYITHNGVVVAKLIEWPELDHDTRLVGFDDPEVISWTFAQSLSNHP